MNFPARSCPRNHTHYPTHHRKLVILLNTWSLLSLQTQFLFFPFFTKSKNLGDNIQICSSPLHCGNLASHEIWVWTCISRRFFFFFCNWSQPLRKRFLYLENAFSLVRWISKAATSTVKPLQQNATWQPAWGGHPHFLKAAFGLDIKQCQGLPAHAFARCPAHRGQISTLCSCPQALCRSGGFKCKNSKNNNGYRLP